MSQVCIKHIRWPIVLFLSLVVSTGFAESAKHTLIQNFEVNKQYLIISDPIRNHPDVLQLRLQDNNKIQVLMFFSYACHWCDRLNKPFDDWAMKHKDKVMIYRLPVAFNRMWASLAKLYYTVQTFDNSKALDNQIFAALHKQGLRLWRPDVLENFIKQQEIDYDQFKATYESFHVDRVLKRANDLSLAYQITATPNIIINGLQKSYLTNLTMTEGIDDLFLVLDYLITKAKTS